MKLICTLGEFAKPASATLPRYCGGAGGSQGPCLHSRGSRLLAWANRARRELGRTQPGAKLPAEPAWSVQAVKALPGCKTPFQAVKPLSDMKRSALLIPTSSVGQQPKEEIPVLLLQVVELMVGSPGACW